MKFDNTKIKFNQYKDGFVPLTLVIVATNEVIQRLIALRRFTHFFSFIKPNQFDAAVFALVFQLRE